MSTHMQMTSERQAYLNGVMAAKQGEVTLRQASEHANYSSFAGLYFCGALDELTEAHLELR